MLVIEPWAAGCVVKMLPLCQVPPPPKKKAKFKFPSICSETSLRKISSDFFLLLLLKIQKNLKRKIPNEGKSLKWKKAFPGLELVLVH